MNAATDLLTSVPVHGGVGLMPETTSDVRSVSLKIPGAMYFPCSLEEVGPRPYMSALWVVVNTELCGNANATMR